MQHFPIYKAEKIKPTFKHSSCKLPKEIVMSLMKYDRYKNDSHLPSKTISQTAVGLFPPRTMCLDENFCK